MKREHGNHVPSTLSMIAKRLSSSLRDGRPWQRPNRGQGASSVTDVRCSICISLLVWLRTSDNGRTISAPEYVSRVSHADYSTSRALETDQSCSSGSRMLPERESAWKWSYDLDCYDRTKKCARTREDSAEISQSLNCAPRDQSDRSRRPDV